MLADLDIFIHSPADPLLNVELHRQFTHSLIFIPAGALLATVLTSWFVRKKLTLVEVYLFTLLGYATSGVMDTMTSYGTKLLWPFVDERYAWNIISVFDPLFTLGILITLGFALYYKNKAIAWAAWGWITFYLLIGLTQRERAEEAAYVLANQRDHAIERMVVKPTIANQLVWSIRYESGDSLHTAGVHLNPFYPPLLYIGESAELVDWQQEYEQYEGTTLYEDIRRFSILSENYLVQHPRYGNVIGDARYAMLPTRIEPLWGIRVNTGKPFDHVPFLNFRDASPEVRAKFGDMILGRPRDNNSQEMSSHD